MKKLWMLAVASGVAVTGCWLQPCPAIDCADVLNVAVRDSVGQPLNAFAGTVTIDYGDNDAGIPARQIRVACGGASIDAGSQSADGGTGYEEQANCTDGGFNLFGGRNGPITASLQSGSLGFSGPVTATFTVSQVGPDHCETSCGSGAATITLQ